MIFHPALAHGSTGPATSERILLLPWFVKAEESGMLEVPTAGTWDDLAASHRDLTYPPKTPLGLPNMYGSIRTPFPATEQLLVLSLVSNALVGRLS
jgi:hypothetical protein